MEAMGEWTGMYTCTTVEEADFINQLLAVNDDSHHHHAGGGGGGVSGDHHGGFWNVGPHELSLNVNAASFYNPMDVGAGFCSFSQESSSYSGGYFPAMAASVDENNTNNNGSSMAFGMEDVTTTTINTNSYLVSDETSNCNVNAEEYSGKGHLPLETVVESHDENLQPEISVTTDQKSLNHSEGSKKRSHATSTDRNKRNTKARRNQKNSSNNNKDEDEGREEEENKGKSKAAAMNRQNSSITCCSEDDSNGGGEASSCKTRRTSSALNLNGKTRASRGAATDPQSLYARKRRERINERLRILQTLVPNGTKVDISTMLEEAVHYVKFLQLQIKLLSSDDMWMYAPIAYNGMDIGLDLKLNTQR